MNENQVKANQEKMEWIEPTFEVLCDPEKSFSFVESTYFGIPYGPS